jgi:hypothetical protein
LLNYLTYKKTPGVKAMPKVTLGRKTIISNEKTDIVIQSYNEAMAGYQPSGEALAPDEKEVTENLKLEDKQELEGLYARILRITKLSNAAFYKLDERVLDLDQWCNEFYLQLNSSILHELAEAIFSDRSTKSLLECSTLNSSTEIDNHFVLICELIQRIVAVALAEDLIKKRKHQSLINDDNVVVLLKAFITNLMIDSNRTKILFGLEGGKKVSILTVFLNDELIDVGAAAINSLIYNAQEINAPSKNFALLADNLARVQKSLRGYILVYLCSVNKELFPRSESLLLTNENLDPNRLLSIYPPVINSLSLQASTLEAAENKGELVPFRSNLIADNYRSLISMFRDSVVKLKNNQERFTYLNYAISQIEQLLIYDEQLEAIMETVNEFSFFCKAGGWIPIMLSLIRPDILSGIIENFKISCALTVKDCFKALNESTNFGVGLICLPRFEWSRLQTINLAIYNLTSPAILQAITQKFTDHIRKMQNAELKLKKFGLMNNDVHIISMTDTLSQLSHSRTSKLLRESSNGSLQEEEMRAAGTPSNRVRTGFDVHTPHNSSRMFQRANTEPSRGTPQQMPRSGIFYDSTPSPPPNRTLHDTPNQAAGRFLQPPGTATPFLPAQHTLQRSPSSHGPMFDRQPAALETMQQPSQFILATPEVRPVQTPPRRSLSRSSCCTIS